MANLYPYTDFHEMNLDWVINKVKELATAWAQVQVDWTNEQEAFNTLKSWIENYFANLNVQVEINNKLDELVLDGTMSELIAPYVSSGLPAEVADQIGAVVANQIGAVVAAQIGAVVADQLPAIAAAAAATEVGTWLSTHIDPDTGYVIDDTLTVQGAAADAKAVGDEVTAIKSALTELDGMCVTKEEVLDDAINEEFEAAEGGNIFNKFFAVDFNNGQKYTLTFDFVSVTLTNSAIRIYASLYDNNNASTPKEQIGVNSDTTGLHTGDVYVKDYYPSSNYKYLRVSLYIPNGTYTEQIDINVDTYITPIMSVKSLSDAVDNRFVADEAVVKNNYLIDLPSYWKTHLDNDIIPSIQNKDLSLGADNFKNGLCGDSFCFVTDMHISRNSMWSPYVIRYICQNSAVQLIFNGGDLIQRYSLEGGGKAKAVEEMTKWKKMIGREYPEYTALGNHDTNQSGPYADSGSTSDPLQTTQFQAVMQKYPEIPINPKCCNYYLDNEAQKIRYIVLNTMLNESTTTNYTIPFLQTYLCGLPSDWTAIIITHEIWVLYTVGVGMGEYCTSMSVIKPKIDEWLGDNSIKCKFVGIVAGHVHMDYFEVVTVNGRKYNLITRNCDCRDGQYSGYDRSENTINEQSVDVVYLNTENKTLDFVRVGAGESDLSRTDSFVYD